MKIHINTNSNNNSKLVIMSSNEYIESYGKRCFPLFYPNHDDIIIQFPNLSVYDIINYLNNTLNSIPPRFKMGYQRKEKKKITYYEDDAIILPYYFVGKSFGLPMLSKDTMVYLRNDSIKDMVLKNCLDQMCNSYPFKFTYFSDKKPNNIKLCGRIKSNINDALTNHTNPLTVSLTTVTNVTHDNYKKNEIFVFTCEKNSKDDDWKVWYSSINENFNLIMKMFNVIRNKYTSVYIDL